MTPHEIIKKALSDRGWLCDGDGIARFILAGLAAEGYDEPRKWNDTRTAVATFVLGLKRPEFPDELYEKNPSYIAAHAANAQHQEIVAAIMALNVFPAPAPDVEAANVEGPHK